MDAVRFNGAAAVRPRAFVDATHSIPSRNSVSTVDAATLGQFHLPTSIASENVSPLRRSFRTDVPAATPRPRRPPARESVATTAVSPQETDLKKLSKRRSRGRVATVESIDPDVNADGLLNESLYARLEAAYRQPSFATLMSDFEAKLGNSILKDTDIESWENIGGSAVESEFRSQEAASSHQSSNCRTTSQVADIPDMASSSSTSAPKAVKKGGSSRRQGNRILKITKNPAVTRRPRKMAAIPEEAVTDTPVAERGGKRRLSLTSRIAMKQNKQSDSSSANAVNPKSMNPEDQDLWSQEIDDLINAYSTSLDLTAPLWDNLDRGLLTAAEENRLAMHMKPMKVTETGTEIFVKNLCSSIFAVFGEFFWLILLLSASFRFHSASTNCKSAILYEYGKIYKILVR